MGDEQEVVIVDKDGNEHIFPAGFNPKRAAAIVRGGSATLPTRPVSAEDFAPKPPSWPATIGDALVGAAKGAAGIGKTALNTGLLLSAQRPGTFDPIVDPLLEPTSEAQRVGKNAEFAAEIGFPAGKALAAGVEAIPSLVSKTGPAAMEVASHLPIVGKYVRGARILGKVLDIAGKAAPASENAGGRLVSRSAPSIEDEMSAALQELSLPEPPARITTPPQPELPAGYTPRTTVPKPKAAKATLPAETSTAAPAAPPKRAYFLKPEAQIADEKAASAAARSAPTRTLSVSDLPASWQARIGQDIFPTTGAEGEAVMNAVRQELRDRGLSVGEAIAAVSRNKNLPVQLRSQLLRALSKTGRVN